MSDVLGEGSVRFYANRHLARGQSDHGVCPSSYSAARSFLDVNYL